jgi:hypothetical protein
LLSFDVTSEYILFTICRKVFEKSVELRDKLELWYFVSLTSRLTMMMMMLET